MSRCLFKDCFNRPPPFSGLTFFNIPKDDRRDVWLQFSGNEQAQNLPPNARRLVCEMHFEEKHLRRQFHRTTLARDAIPMCYSVKKAPPAPKRKKKKTKPRGGGDGDAEMELIVQEVPDKCMTDPSPSETAEYEMIIEDECLASNDQILCLAENDGSIEVITEHHPLQANRNPASVRQVIEEIEISFCSNDNQEDIEPVKKVECKSASTQTDEQSPEKPPLPQTTDQATNTDPVVEEPSKEPTLPPQPTNPISTKAMTEDDYFALSLVGPLQKLTPEQRAMAKVKILTYLVQLQCGVDANL